MKNRLHYLLFCLLLLISFNVSAQKCPDPFNPEQLIDCGGDFSQIETDANPTYKVLGTLQVFEKELPWFLERTLNKAQPVNAYSEHLFLRIRKTKQLNWAAFEKQELIKQLSLLKASLAQFLPNVVFIREHHPSTTEIVFGPFFNQQQAQVIQNLIKNYNIDLRESTMDLNTDLVFRTYELNIKPGLAILQGYREGIFSVKEGGMIGTTPWRVIKISQNSIVAYNEKKLKRFHPSEFIK